MKKSNWFSLFLIILSCHVALSAQKIVTATEGPRFSPDGKQFVFSESVLQLGTGPATKLSESIAIVNIDGTKYKPVTKNTTGTLDGDASFSPDGKKIVFRRIKKEPGTFEQGDIYIINADGTGLKQLTNQPSDERFPEFSVDGKSVVFVRRTVSSVGKIFLGELVSASLQDFKEQVLIAKEMRVKQAIPVPTGRGGFLIACAEIDGTGKPMPKSDMLAVASPTGELDPRAFMKLPMPGKQLQITRIHATFAPTNTAFYVAATEEGFFGDSHAFKITPKEAKVLPNAHASVSSFLSLSPDGKQNVIGTGYPLDTLLVRDFAADNFDGKETRIKIQK